MRLALCLLAVALSAAMTVLEPEAAQTATCTSHEYQGRTYYHNWESDESSWATPSNCKIIPYTEIHLPSQSIATAQMATLSYKFHERIHKAWEPFSSDAITLTVQADIKRIEKGMLNRIAKQWKGPISAAILTPSLDRVLDFLNKNSNDEIKNWVDVHAVVASEQWKHYPINKMRNYAISPVRTAYVMVVDLDEHIAYTMHHHQQQLVKAAAGRPGNAIYLVTSWQWSIENPPAQTPHSLAELTELFEKGQAAVKHPEYPQAYEIPGRNFWAWRSLDSHVEVPYQDGFEPYFICKKSSLPMFDERFSGFGGNKAIHTTMLAMDNFRFVLLPRVFTWSTDSPSQGAVHSPPPNPKLISDAWWELGHAHGCDKCAPTSCVKSCPGLFNKNFRAASSDGTSQVVAPPAALQPAPIPAAASTTSN